MHRRVKKEKEYSKDKFRFDEEKDEYTCPKGKTLEYFHDITLKDQKGSLYGARLKKYVYCPFKNQCLTGEDINSGYRTIEDDAFAVFRHAMKA